MTSFSDGFWNLFIIVSTLGGLVGLFLLTTVNSSASVSERGDGEPQADRLVERLLGYRVFSDEAGKMNLSVTDIGGGLLLVPQFTLPADTRKGMRPSFTPAAPPNEGERLFGYLVDRARAAHATQGAHAAL